MKNWREGWTATVGVSVSDAPDLAAMGLSEGHLHDAMETVAAKLLAFGYRLAYGGDLRPDGFTERLIEFAATYDRSAASNGVSAVTDYLAWPVHISMVPEQKHALAEGLGNVADISWLSADGEHMDADECVDIPAQQPDTDTWAHGLTAMRRTMTATTNARLVLGGKVEGFKGALPGIAEETLLALRCERPVYILGGFGGCARDIAESLGLIEPDQKTERDWNGRSFFAGANLALNNGLTEEENRALAKTPHIDEAVLLTLTGLERIAPELEARP